MSCGASAAAAARQTSTQQDVSSQRSRFARPRVAPRPALRFASVAGPADGSVHWLLKRNCSIDAAPAGSASTLSLCVVSLGIGGAFWWHGAPLVLPFAGLELLAVGAALLVYARHAADRERMALRPGRLTVELHASAGAPSRSSSRRAWVRVEPAHRRPLADRALGPGPAHRGRPLRAPGAAPRAGRRAARGAARGTARPSTHAPERRTTRTNSRNVATQMMTMQSLSRRAPAGSLLVARRGARRSPRRR